MANKQYQTDSLQPGDTFVVRGRTHFARLTHILEGQELADEIKRAAQYGRIAPANGKPHTSVTLTDAFVERVNPQAPTLAELYAEERLFRNKEGKTCYTAVRANDTLADYGVPDPQDPTKVKQVYLDPNKLLANGIDTRCYFRIYAGKAGMHNGVSLDTVVFLDPITYYEASSTAQTLAGRGLTFERSTETAPDPHTSGYSAADAAYPPAGNPAGTPASYPPAGAGYPPAGNPAAPAGAAYPPAGNPAGTGYPPAGTPSGNPAYPPAGTPASYPPAGNPAAPAGTGYPPAGYQQPQGGAPAGGGFVPDATQPAGTPAGYTQPNTGYPAAAGDSAFMNPPQGAPQQIGNANAQDNNLPFRTY